MTGFTIGWIAAAIWLLVAVGLWYLHNHTPRHPFKSIGQFRKARRKLAEPIAAPHTSIRLVAPSAPTASTAPDQAAEIQLDGENNVPSEQDEELVTRSNDFPVSDEQLALFRPSTPAQGARPTPDEPELDEINEVIESVTSEERPRRKSTRQRTQTDTRKRRTAAADKPIRKIGRLTYVVVDEEGKPQADPR
ncbi:MAG: hypothetical protein KY429_06295 [Actinobacteria bacterium]|nr:hypothetical protein [Actinomycetota bacterium]